MDRGFWSYGLFWQIASQQPLRHPPLRQRQAQDGAEAGAGDRLVRYAPVIASGSTCRVPMRLRVIAIESRAFALRRWSPPDRWSHHGAAMVGLATRHPAGITLEGGSTIVGDETSFREMKVSQKMEGCCVAERWRHRIRSPTAAYLLVRWADRGAAVKKGLDPLPELPGALSTSCWTSHRPCCWPIRPHAAQVLVSGC